MNIGFHTRLDSNNNIKVTGGSFNGALDYSTINNLVNAFFSIKVKNSGRLVFVDKGNREVSLYISIDADKTEAGKNAKKNWIENKRIQLEKDKLLQEQQEEELEKAMQGLSYEEIIKRLAFK